MVSLILFKLFTFSQILQGHHKLSHATVNNEIIKMTEHLHSCERPSEYGLYLLLNLIITSKCNLKSHTVLPLTSQTTGHWIWMLTDSFRPVLLTCTLRTQICILYVFRFFYSCRITRSVWPAFMVVSNIWGLWSATRIALQRASVNFKLLRMSCFCVTTQKPWFPRQKPIEFSAFG